MTIPGSLRSEGHQVVAGAQGSSTVELGARVPAAFAVALRQAGLDVPNRASIGFTDAIDVIDVTERSQLYWAAHACFVRRPEDVETFTHVFAAFFDGAPAVLVDADSPPVVATTLSADGDDNGNGNGSASDPGGVDDSVRWSAAESLAHRDFAACTAEELHELHRLIARLRPDHPMRASRRRRASTGPAGRFDLAGTAREALRTGGEPLSIRRTTTTERPRTLVLLLDVSGSMDSYSRSLLRFGHAMSLGRRRVEVFAMGTRLTRISRSLRSHDPDAALTAAADEIFDQGGGTRLGETVRAFNDEWGIRGMARGATVVICSDGWDRGDPAELGAQMQRLSRVTHRLVWVNPLKASDGYAPLAGGMAAALPHLDDFVPGHSLHSLERLAELVAR